MTTHNTQNAEEQNERLRNEETLYEINQIGLFSYRATLTYI